MIRLLKALVRLDADLRALGLPWAMVGGLALSVRTTPRTTNDIDVVIAVADDSEAEQIVRGFQNRGYRIQPRGVLEQKEVGRLATVRLLLTYDADDIEVDLLFASSGVESEVVALSQIVEILPGTRIPVARTGHLIALKVLAGRDKDRADVHSLLKDASVEDLQMAKETLILIERRGFHRGQNLLVDLSRLEAPER